MVHPDISSQVQSGKLASKMERLHEAASLRLHCEAFAA